MLFLGSRHSPLCNPRQALRLDFAALQGPVVQILAFLCPVQPPPGYSYCPPGLEAAVYALQVVNIVSGVTMLVAYAILITEFTLKFVLNGNP